MTHAIRYHRFSSRRQDRGSSIERQQEATAELCRRKGWQVVETIEDKGQSAWKGDHLSVGHLGRLRQRIDAGLVDPGTVLVVENLDRLSRQDYRTARRWIEDVTDNGIIVAVCRPELMLDGAAMSGANIGAMLQHLLEANRATSESTRKSHFQKKNIARMLDMVRAGICPSPRVHGWLNGVVGERLTINEERVALVNLIYEWSASGMGLQSICKKLNAEHAPWTKGWKTGKAEWKIGYVRDILNSPAVEGKYIVRVGTDRKSTGEVITGYYPRIVDVNLVNRARAAIKKRTGTGGPSHGKAQNLFVGLAVCKKCGGSVGRVAGGNNYAYMVCRASRYGTCDNNNHVSYPTLEKAVIDHLLHLALDDDHFTSVDDIAPTVAALSAANTIIDTLQTEQANIIRFLRRSPYSDALAAELDKIEAALKDANRMREEADRKLLAARGSVSPAEHLVRVRTVRNALDSDPEARRMVREALSALIERIEFDPTHDGASLFLRHYLGLMIVHGDGKAMFWNLSKDGSVGDHLRCEEKTLIEAYQRRVKLSKAAMTPSDRSLPGPRQPLRSLLAKERIVRAKAT